ncbi:MAG: SUMF1/EgtB/PvdO family nonheme iron enzyme [Myxococcales bacterium]|nr:SUMF1/EgtB/PvdO family nonheme iron enzyme [Myxococcales bacterium]
MALLTSGLPRDAVKKGRIVGDAAIALAREGKAFCVDTHEYPGAGRPPRTGVNFEAARGLCRSAGKRLCTDAEWRRACVGKGGAGFPYGARFDAGRCNTEDAEGEERAVAAAGSFKRCVSAVGAYDMSGNVAEWTADQTVRGGDFASADDDAACSAGGKRAPASARASIGFRCCADFTDAAP